MAVMGAPKLWDTREPLGQLREVDTPSLASLRQAYTQAELLGVSPQDLPQREAARGSRFDSRVTTPFLENIHSLRLRAQEDFFQEISRSRHSQALRPLLAPTSRAIDHSVDHQAIQILITKLFQQGRGEELLAAINRGPNQDQGHIAWDRPTNDIETIASAVRWSALSSSAKRRIRTNAEVRSWITQSLEAEGVETKARLGGVSAVSAL